MISFFKLIRYKNLLMIALMMFLTEYALIGSSGYFSIPERGFVFVGLIVLLVAAAGYIVNDIYDVQSDLINKPKSTYVTKTISKRKAWVYYSILTSFGVIFSILFIHNVIHGILFLGTPFLLWLYSKYIKGFPLIGNILISVIATFPIITIYSFFDINDALINVKRLNLIISVYVLFGFLSSLIREIIKDIEDMNGDNSKGLKTLPILIGVVRTRNITVGISIVFLVFLIWFLKELYLGTYYIGVCFISIAFVLTMIFIYKLWSTKKQMHFRFLSNLMKLVMLMGILSMITFKFN